jgi:predicted ABC-type ATPase
VAFAKAKYEIDLNFICTEHPSLNVARVQTRVQQGGHDVPSSKVHSRYSGAIRTAVAAKAIVDFCHLYDNSEHNQAHRLVARFRHGEPDFLDPQQPGWTQPFLR